MRFEESTVPLSDKGCADGSTSGPLLHFFTLFSILAPCPLTPNSQQEGRSFLLSSRVFRRDGVAAAGVMRRERERAAAQVASAQGTSSALRSAAAGGATQAPQLRPSVVPKGRRPARVAPSRTPALAGAVGLARYGNPRAPPESLP
jgi:hypothetical protein